MIRQIDTLTGADLASITDHTYLKTVGHFSNEDNPVKARREDFRGYLERTLKLESAPYAVCVRHEDVFNTRNFLKDSGIKIAAVAGFPDGSCPSEIKLGETLLALDSGAEEIDFVLNYGRLMAGHKDYVRGEIDELVKLAQEYGAKTKMILETSELNSSQISSACRIARYSGVDFVKTSTGFSSGGANVEDLRIMRNIFPLGVKMSGKVRKENVYDLLRAASGRRDDLIDLDPNKIRIGAGFSFLENFNK